MKNRIVVLILFSLFSPYLNAQIVDPVKWQISCQKVDQEVYNIICKATIEDSWDIYDTELQGEGPLPTTFNVDQENTQGVQLIGKLQSTVQAQKEYSNAFRMEVKFFQHSVIFTQRIKVSGAKAKLEGHIEYMACRKGLCIPPAEAKFKFEFNQ